MKKRILVVLFFLWIINVNAQTKTTAPAEVVVPEFGKILDSLKIKGSVLIFDLGKNSFYSNDFTWAKKGHLPASTFKIPNSIIALETGVVKNDSVVFKWNGEKRSQKAWEQDLTFKKAFQVSCVPCYQEIARGIGLKRMKSYLKKLAYNTMVFGPATIDNFWLQGESKISQLQQIDFLRRLYFSELPISDRTQSIMKDIMEIEKTDQYVLRGKTGWGFNNKIDNGWIVGYIEKDDKVYFFATNIEPGESFKIDDFRTVRIIATKEAFRKLEILK
ncbi:class D beta-lactamase [Flavobacterium cheongpyeongense]|uniref:Beta-lactamase n=1 Tax=Flavobacterium cheongpyeongense TaxID=2212651 RepID=A0A2V4BKC6_9FLAO|nr:class D beta-lactamase [Flavobacterium cheongpyeongense]PXY38982.1 class D beta-lactamase [Flavobacterium cheongpyeongense]